MAVTKPAGVRSGRAARRADQLRGPAARAAGDPAAPRQQPAADPDRRRRGRQDPAGAADGGRGTPQLPGRRLVRRAGRRCTTRSWCRTRWPTRSSCARSRPTRPPTSRRTSRHSSSSWCWTTASTSPTPARCSPASCCRAPRAARSSRPAGDVLGVEGEQILSRATALAHPTPEVPAGDADPLRVGDALPRARRGGGAGLRDHRRQPGRGGRAVPPARRHPAGDRAGRGLAAHPAPRRRSSTGSRTGSGC